MQKEYEKKKEITKFVYNIPFIKNEDDNVATLLMRKNKRSKIT